MESVSDPDDQVRKPDGPSIANQVLDDETRQLVGPVRNDMRQTQKRRLERRGSRFDQARIGRAHDAAGVSLRNPQIDLPLAATLFHRIDPGLQRGEIACRCERQADLQCRGDRSRAIFSAPSRKTSRCRFSSSGRLPTRTASTSSSFPKVLAPCGTAPGCASAEARLARGFPRIGQEPVLARKIPLRTAEYRESCGKTDGETSPGPVARPRLSGEYNKRAEFRVWKAAWRGENENPGNPRTTAMSGF